MANKKVWGRQFINITGSWLTFFFLSRYSLMLCAQHNARDLDKYKKVQYRNCVIINQSYDCAIQKEEEQHMVQYNCHNILHI